MYYYYYYYAVFNAPYVCQSMTKSQAYTGCANKKTIPRQNFLFQLCILLVWFWAVQTLYVDIHRTYPANFIETTNGSTDGAV